VDLLDGESTILHLRLTIWEEESSIWKITSIGPTLKTVLRMGSYAVRKSTEELLQRRKTLITVESQWQSLSLSNLHLISWEVGREGEVKIRKVLTPYRPSSLGFNSLCCRLKPQGR
jgi:hypothetical protein